ncbi:methylated-dna--protein-cysteine methyltransferase [Streptococcus salivarius 57.I]|nr:methylated-dna--protein-cysteine methyltransferase [Streptococcus salivarius 57.I]
MLYRQYYLSPIGRLCLVASDQALYGVWLEGQKHFSVRNQGRGASRHLKSYLENDQELVRGLF